MTFDLVKTIENFRVYRFTNELNNKNNTKYTKRKLEYIINNLTKKNQPSIIEQCNLEINNLLYDKEWKNLQPFYKEIKIKEYVNDKYKHETKETLNQILKLVSNNKNVLNDNTIVYENCSIQSIPNLIKTKNVYSYKINKNKNI